MATIHTGEPILDQFLGDDEFPIEWPSELEKELFWVFDDLHCPHPLSPMFEDIGGWWLTCDHMFRRFGTPFAADWITKNVNGFLYTAAVPADMYQLDYAVLFRRPLGGARGSSRPSARVGASVELGDTSSW